MELGEAQGCRIRKTRMAVSDFMKERLEKMGQTNSVSRVSLVARETREPVLERGDSVAESDE